MAEAEVPGDGDAGRLVVEPLLRDGGPVGEVAERRAAPVEEQDQAGGRKGGNARARPLPSRLGGHLSPGGISVEDSSDIQSIWPIIPVSNGRFFNQMYPMSSCSHPCLLLPYTLSLSPDDGDGPTDWQELGWVRPTKLSAGYPPARRPPDRPAELFWARALLPAGLRAPRCAHLVVSLSELSS